jgi:uncharacterized membrane protein YbaN (DUF454 family)
MTEGRTIQKPRSRALRSIYFALGIICVGLAYLSWLPGIPTFDFVILAAFFFARSSDRFHDWLVNHPIFGKVIRGYRSDGFSIRTKLAVSLAVVASLGFSIMVLASNATVRTVMAVAGLIGIWFIWSRKTKVAATGASQTTSA